MGVAIGYLVVLSAVTVAIFVRLSEARRAHLVSPVEAPKVDDGPSLSSVPLRIVLATVFFLALLDAAFLTILLPPVMVSLIEEMGRRIPELNRLHYAVNLALDLVILRLVWGCWRRRRKWHVAGVVVSGVVLLLVLAAWKLPTFSLPRWSRRELVVSMRGELVLYAGVFFAWVLLSALTLLTPKGKKRAPTFIDEEWAARTEPLSPPERVRVRWARGEATTAERDGIAGPGSGGS